jgi:hypothetical protein
MRKLKHLSSIAVLAIMSAIFASTASWAETITGTFQVVEDIQVQQYDNATPIGNPVTYTDVPTIFNFTLTAYTPTPTGGGYVQYSLVNSILSFNTNLVPNSLMSQYLSSIVDGIPGQSADEAYGVVASSAYRVHSLIAQFGLFDPSGEFIGPNGDGNPSDVQILG